MDSVTHHFLWLHWNLTPPFPFNAQKQVTQKAIAVMCIIQNVGRLLVFIGTTIIGRRKGRERLEIKKLYYVRKNVRRPYSTGALRSHLWKLGIENKTENMVQARRWIVMNMAATTITTSESLQMELYGAILMLIVQKFKIFHTVGRN